MAPSKAASPARRFLGLILSLMGAGVLVAQAAPTMSSLGTDAGACELVEIRTTRATLPAFGGNILWPAYVLPDHTELWIGKVREISAEFYVVDVLESGTFVLPEFSSIVPDRRAFAFRPLILTKDSVASIEPLRP